MSCFSALDFIALFSGGCFNAFFLRASNVREIDIIHHVKYLFFPPPDDVLGLFFRVRKVSKKRPRQTQGRIPRQERVEVSSKMGSCLETLFYSSLLPVPLL